MAYSPSIDPDSSPFKYPRLPLSLEAPLLPTRKQIRKSQLTSVRITPITRHIIRESIAWTRIRSRQPVRLACPCITQRISCNTRNRSRSWEHRAGESSGAFWCIADVAVLHCEGYDAAVGAACAGYGEDAVGEGGGEEGEGGEERGGELHFDEVGFVFEVLKMFGLV